MQSERTGDVKESLGICIRRSSTLGTIKYPINMWGRVIPEAVWTWPVRTSTPRLITLHPNTNPTYWCLFASSQFVLCRFKSCKIWGFPWTTHFCTKTALHCGLALNKMKKLPFALITKIELWLDTRRIVLSSSFPPRCWQTTPVNVVITLRSQITANGLWIY